MPSPFTHLNIAEEIRSEIIRKGNTSKRFLQIMDVGWPAFYMGSVAPDFQTISGQPRELTHFFRLPPRPGNQAYPKMFSMYPRLAKGHELPLNRAAFIAAYSAHLLLDLIWFREILIPYFHEVSHLGDLQERRLIHLILLTYIDKVALSRLADNAQSVLSRAQVENWLPFASDEHLKNWQEFLIKQLGPSGTSETVRIYAGRLQMTPERFADKLEDREWMKNHLFSKIPVEKVFDIVNSAVPRSIEVITKYLNGEFVSEYHHVP